MHNSVDFCFIQIDYLEEDEDWGPLFDLHLRLTDLHLEDFEDIRSEEEIEMGKVLIKLYNLMKDKCGALKQRKERLLEEMLNVLKKN